MVVLGIDLLCDLPGHTDIVTPLPPPPPRSINLTIEITLPFVGN